MIAPLELSKRKPVAERVGTLWRQQEAPPFLLKGFGIAEIASMRGSAEGAIKAHLKAVYGKSGTHIRSEVFSLVIDSLMDDTAARAGQHGYNG